MTEDAELFIKAERAQVPMIDQGQRQIAVHMLSSHTHKYTCK